MEESSRGYQESNPPSRDLMARFDMAHDRADRLPEVRKYLENLRPQILKLQKELRLQTDEDIAGLDRRDDLEMNDVDVLVDLIKAFSKAWKENRISKREIEWMESAEAMRAAGPAFREMARLVRDVAENPKASPEARASVIEGIAMAGEPALAWRLASKLLRDTDYGTVGVGEDYWVNWFPAFIAIWTGYARRGERLPGYSEQSFARSLSDNAIWSLEKPEEIRIRSEIGLTMVRALVDSGCWNEGVLMEVVDQITELEPRMNALQHLRENARGGMRVHSAELAIEKEMSENGFKSNERIEYFFRDGRTEKALEMLADYPYDQNLVVIAAKWAARGGETERAFALLEGCWNSAYRMLAASAMAAAFCERGDLESARRAIGTDRKVWRLMDCRDVTKIVEEFLHANETEFATELAMSMMDIKTGPAWDLGESIKRTVAQFADRGLDPRPFLKVIADADSAATDEETPPRFANALRVAKASLAFRTFKRAARLYRPLGSSRDAEWDREAWERETKAVLDAAPEIAKELSYDEPID